MDYSKGTDVPLDELALIQLVQDLEQEAILDYKTIAILARENDDIETEKFFTELMEDEMHHFDEISRCTNTTREIGE